MWVCMVRCNKKDSQTHTHTPNLQEKRLSLFTYLFTIILIIYLVEVTFITFKLFSHLFTMISMIDFVQLNFLLFKLFMCLFKMMLMVYFTLMNFYLFKLSMYLFLNDINGLFYPNELLLRPFSSRARWIRNFSGLDAVPIIIRLVLSSSNALQIEH